MDFKKPNSYKNTTTSSFIKTKKEVEKTTIENLIQVFKDLMPFLVSQ